MRIAVAGGTGVVGRRVVETLTEQGHEPVVLARSLGVDVATGAGLSDALAGATAVIDVSNAATLRRRTSVQFFTNSSTNLLAAGERAGVQHHVALSIVGIDRVDTGYYAGKRRQEDVVLAGPLPASVLRATQFHEFAGQLLSRTPGRFAPVPQMLVQPVAAHEVAAALVQLATGEAAGRAPDLGGPKVHQLVDLARRLLQARGEQRRVVPLRLPGAAARQMRLGGLLPGTRAQLGTQTFDEWLTETITLG